MNHSLKYLIVIISLLFGLKAEGQVTFYQDVYHGGITYCGTSTADGSGSVNLPIYIEPGSTIRKVFLIAYSYSPFTNGPISDIYVGVNGPLFELNFDDNLIINTPDLTSNIIGLKSIQTHILDITNQFVSGANVNIYWPGQTGVISCQSCVYGAPGIVILYENPILPRINAAIEINNQLNSYHTILNFNDLNPANLANDICFGVHSDRSAGSPTDGYTFKVNGTNIGSVSSSDILSLGGSGIIGSFYFQNGQCFGLTDDTPDDFINGSDGLARINNYCNNTLNNLQIDVDYIVPPIAPHNNLVGLYFAYSTPCDTFSVSVPTDTTICRGASLQLNASGGSQYEWQPATDLSCSSCPNPVFTGDSTQLYTVRIWNNDSCSVVRPVKVKVQSCAGLNEEMLESAFSIYPNPSNGNFTLENEALNTAFLKVEVIDLLGKSHHAETINFEHKHSLALSLAAGTYILKVSDEHNAFAPCWTERIVLE